MTSAASPPELIECLPEEPARRVARLRQFLANTIYFNSYYKGFATTREARAAKKARLNQWPFEQDIEDVRELLAQDGDPVFDLLDRLPTFGVLRDSSHMERQEWRDQWEQVETTLNARLAVAFALTPADLLGRIMETLLPEAGPLGPLSLAMVRSSEIRKSTQGFADLILKGPKSVVLIELKVRGLSRNHSYDVSQLLKYCTLAADEQATWEAPSIRRFTHLLLRPRGGGGCVSHRSRWFQNPAASGGPVRIERAGLRDLAERARLTAEFDRERALGMLDYVRYTTVTTTSSPPRSRTIPSEQATDRSAGRFSGRARWQNRIPLQEHPR